MKLRFLLALLLFTLFSCSADRFLVQENKATSQEDIYSSQVSRTMSLDKEIKAELSKTSQVGFFQSDSSYYSPFEISQIELKKGYYTLQLNSLVGQGFIKPFMFPIVKVFNSREEEVEVEIIQNRKKGSTFSLPAHIKTFWKVKNPEDQNLKILVYADRTPMEGNQWSSNLAMAPSVPLIFPIPVKSLKVPYGRYQMKIVLFHPDHYKVKKSKL